MHGFLGPLRQSYRQCGFCDERKSLVCVKCGLCYTCHPLAEKMAVA